MNKILLFFYLLLISSSVISQDENASKAFDSIFYHIAVNVSSANPPRAMHMADSLYTYSSNDKQRLKSLMLKADILEKQEKRGEAIQHALKALKFAEQEKDYSFQARIYGFLSTQYRTIGFLDKGKESLKKGLEVSSNIENKDQVTKYRAMVNHEMAEYAYEEKEYEKAIEYLNQAILTYEREENETFKNFVIGNSEELLGRANMALQNKEKAFIHFSKADRLINKAGAGNTLWAALIYQDLGNTFKEKKNLDSAEVYLKKSLLIAENGNHASLKQNVYKSLSEYYLLLNQNDSFSKYDLKFNTILTENEAKKKEMVNSAYRTLGEYPENTSESTSENKAIYIVGLIALVLLIAYGIYYKRKTLLGNPENASDKNKINNLKSPDIIPVKAEKELLMKLNEFEESKDFLNKNLSMSHLIVRFDTNTKYLRLLLKKHRNKDYNEYINALRINYIVNKLETDPKYRNYKISYLADESGFSSHSKFSADFKSVVQLSPSEFINSIAK